MIITQREQRTLDYIIDTIEKKGYSPSVRDIQKALGYKSTSTVYNCLKRLDAAGYIKKEGGKSRTIRVVSMVDWAKTRVPIIGKVTAGLPVLSLERYDGYISVVANSIGCSQNNLFAYKICGSSMIEAGITDGDVVIADKRDYAADGDIVVAMHEGRTMVKTFHHEDAGYRLQPQNRLMPPIYTNKVLILGKVVACMRIY